MAARRPSGTVQPCRHFHSASGCALGSLCPHAHIGLQRRSDGLLRHTAAAPVVAAARPMWFFRENAMPQRDNTTLRWRRLSEAHTDALEEALNQHQTVKLSGSLVADLSRMIVYDRFDTGSRRPLQRLLCSSTPQWFGLPLNDDNGDTALPDDDDDLLDVRRRSGYALHFSADVADTIEFAYVSGIFSYFGLRAAERPLWVNLSSMTALEIESGLRLRLHRQPFGVQHGCPASNLYGHPLLLLRGEYVDLSGSRLLPCPVDMPRADLPAELRGMNDCVPASVYLATPPPEQSCRAQQCLLRRRDPAHLRTARHLCPLGRRTECFLCSLGWTADGSQLNTESAEELSSSGNTTVQQIALRRATAHVQLFVPADGPSLGNMAAALEWRTAQRARTPSIEKVWRDHSREPEVPVVYLNAPNDRSRTRRRSSTLISIASPTTVTFLCRDTPEYSALADVLSTHHSFVTPCTAHIQRIDNHHRLRELVRFRNEIQEMWLGSSPLERDSAMSCFCDTRFLPVTDLSLLLTHDSSKLTRATHLFSTIGDAIAAASKNIHSDSDADPAPMRIAFVTFYPGPTGGCSELPTLRRGDDSDPRRCVLNLTTSSADGCEVAHDTSQWWPLYVLSMSVPTVV